MKIKALNKKNQFGRSVVEILAVLALIGVLSLGALGGYSWAMDKYRSNTLSREVLQRSADVKYQLDLRRRNITLNRWNERSLIGYQIGLEDGTPETIDGKTTVGIQVDEVAKRVCQMTFEGNINLFDIKVNSTRYERDTEKDTTEVCQYPTGNTMVFYIDEAWGHDRNKPVNTAGCPTGSTYCSTASDNSLVCCVGRQQCIDGECVGCLDDNPYYCSEDACCPSESSCDTESGLCTYTQHCSPFKPIECWDDDGNLTCCKSSETCRNGTCVSGTSYWPTGGGSSSNPSNGPGSVPSDPSDPSGGGGGSNGKSCVSLRSADGDESCCEELSQRPFPLKDAIWVEKHERCCATFQYGRYEECCDGNFEKVGSIGECCDDEDNPFPVIDSERSKSACCPSAQYKVAVVKQGGWDCCHRDDVVESGDPFCCPQNELNDDENCCGLKNMTWVESVESGSYPGKCCQPNSPYLADGNGSHKVCCDAIKQVWYEQAQLCCASGVQAYFDQGTQKASCCDSGTLFTGSAITNSSPTDSKTGLPIGVCCSPSEQGYVDELGKLSCIDVATTTPIMTSTYPVSTVPEGTPATGGTCDKGYEQITLTEPWYEGMTPPWEGCTYHQLGTQFWCCPIASTPQTMSLEETATTSPYGSDTTTPLGTETTSLTTTSYYGSDTISSTITLTISTETTTPITTTETTVPESTSPLSTPMTTTETTTTDGTTTTSAPITTTGTMTPFVSTTTTETTTTPITTTETTTTDGTTTTETTTTTPITTTETTTTDGITTTETTTSDPITTTETTTTETTTSVPITTTMTTTTSRQTPTTTVTTTTSRQTPTTTMTTTTSRQTPTTTVPAGVYSTDLSEVLESTQY